MKLLLLRDGTQRWDPKWKRRLMTEGDQHRTAIIHLRPGGGLPLDPISEIRGASFFDLDPARDDHDAGDGGQQVEQPRDLGRRRALRARRITDTIEASMMKNVDISLMTDAVSEDPRRLEIFPRGSNTVRRAAAAMRESLS